MTTNKRLTARRFGADDDQRILEEYGRVPVAKTAQALKRSMRSVHERARILFAKHRPQRDGAWLVEEVERLRQHFGLLDCPADILSLVVGRSERSIALEVARRRKCAEEREEPLTGPEMLLLRQIFGRRELDALAVIFVAPPRLIETTAAQMRLSKDKAYLARKGERTRMPRWDPATIKELRRLHPTHDNQEIARRLGRSTKSVASKAHQLGLKKSLAHLQRMGRQNIKGRYKQ